MQFMPSAGGAAGKAPPPATIGVVSVNEQVVAIQTGLSGRVSPLGVAQALSERMIELEKYFSKGVKWTMPDDRLHFVKISMAQVTETLAEAVILVFLVMFSYLQNFR